MALILTTGGLVWVTTPPAGPGGGLVPGAGNWSAFDTTVAGLGQIGSGQYSTAKAIARWDVVPYQTFTGTLPLGIVAFHAAGITRVDFYLDGGPAFPVSVMTLNATTGVWEYVAPFDASTVSDGQHEIRAIVYPVKGYCRVFSGPIDTSIAAHSLGEHSMFLSSNHGGGLTTPIRYVAGVTGSDSNDGLTPATPKATIGNAVSSIQSAVGNVNGARVILNQAANYTYPNVGSATNTTRWLTIEAGAGLTRSQVRITANAGYSGGIGTAMIQLKGIGVNTGIPGGPIAQNRRIWVHDCAVELSGGGDVIKPFAQDDWAAGVYMTAPPSNWGVSRLHQYPCIAQILTRNVVLSDTQADSLRDLCGLHTNIEIKDFDTSDPNAHNDVLQLYSPYPRDRFGNLVFYNVKAVQNCPGQGIFVQVYAPIPGGSVNDVAFVNWGAYSAAYSQLQTPMDHVVIWHCTICQDESLFGGMQGGFLITEGPAGNIFVTNLSIRNTVFQDFVTPSHAGGEPTLGNQYWADNNHFQDIVTFSRISVGTNATTGGTLASLFVDPTGGNFTPAAGSPILARGAPLIPADYNGAARAGSSALGFLKGTGEA